MRVLSMVLLVTRAWVGVSSTVKPARAWPRPALGRAPESERTVVSASVDVWTLPMVSERTVMSASVDVSILPTESERTVISASVCL